MRPECGSSGVKFADCFEGIGGASFQERALTAQVGGYNGMGFALSVVPGSRFCERFPCVPAACAVLQPLAQWRNVHVHVELLPSFVRLAFAAVPDFPFNQDEFHERIKTPARLPTVK